MTDPARAIESLIYRYAECIDAGDFAGVADLFDRGRIVSLAPDGAAFPVEGHDQVLAMYRNSVRLYEDGTPRTKHVTSNVIVEAEPDADVAEARSYYTVLQAVTGHPLQPIISGRYHDTFRRDDGRWRFDTRTTFTDLIGDLSHHLLFDLPG